MKNLLTVLLLAAVFTSCSKSARVEEKYADCDVNMIEKFKNEITCTEIPTSGPCSYLAKGKYKGELIYFTNIVCSSCNTVAPQEGYNCEDEKVVIEDFIKNVTDIVAVKPARSDK
ncbi:MAG: hypothetical protein QM594_19915 [Niabella sp.]